VVFGRRKSELENRLAQEPEYRPVVLARLMHPTQIAAASRYQVGDLIRVPRTGGHFSLGLVTERKDSGELVVQVHSQKSGKPSIKELDAVAVAKANPLKIGDFFELEGVSFWITGIDDEGEFVVLTDTGERVDPAEFRQRLEAAIVALDAADTVQMSASELRKARDGAKERAPTTPLPLARPMDGSPYVPIESIFDASSATGLIAGNKETDTVYGLVSPMAGAALHTDRGHNYKSWNEDGGALFADRRGRLYVGVFDQAGGEGSDANHLGAASAVAAQALFDQMRESARADHGPEEALEALAQAALRAHRAILARGHGEVSTFVAARIDETDALIVNVGDSGAMHFDAQGVLLDRTQPQGVGRILLEGLGMTRENRDPQQESYRWLIAPGHHLVFGSDGLLDSKLDPKEIGQMVRSAPSAAQATRMLRDEVRERMRTKTGKPDNLTVLVVRIGEK
jgi:serine/threonine protein phosphatase PrpC